MSAVQSTHQFADAATSQIQGLMRYECQPIKTLESALTLAILVIIASLLSVKDLRMQGSQSGKRKVCQIAAIIAERTDPVVDRKPVDPPPIIQLKISPEHDRNQNYLQSALFLLFSK